MRRGRWNSDLEWRLRAGAVSTRRTTMNERDFEDAVLLTWLVAALLISVFVTAMEVCGG